MDERKVIIPSEIKVCATCSYWDGERRVDDEVGVVVVSDSCQGECLAKESARHSLHDVRKEEGCLWEPLHADAADEAAEDTDAPTGDSAV